jgi:hypothetical protein
MKLTANQIYTYASYDIDDEDILQDFVIHMLEGSKSYDASISSPSTFVQVCARNFKKDVIKKQTRKNKREGSTISLNLVDFIIADELEEYEIVDDITYEEKALEIVSNYLYFHEIKFLREMFEKGYDASKKVKLSRIREKIKNKQKQKKYNLLEFSTNKVYEIDYLKEASEITGCNHQLISQCLIKGDGIFKKKQWKIYEV